MVQPPVVGPPRPRHLITPHELAALQHERDDVRILDVRWSLGGPAGGPLHAEGHIPGAVYVDLETELAGTPVLTEGRHPLPELAALQAAARRWGINPSDTVVVYDDLGGHSAARAWWLLRYAGVVDVRLLDGALAAWRGAGLPLQSGATSVAPGTIHLDYGHLPTLSMEEAGNLPEHGILLDARAAERFRGEVEPVDPRAGHIPGAVSAPASGNLGTDGTFRSPAELAARYEQLGVRPDTPVGVYCGSGVTAAHDALALMVAGFWPALYPGSWSQWSNHPERPVATGE
ncbi:sulfurtransferase [Parafrigoribacterium mesophilum]|uniref:sulfurtransferase n=1 Tax=Parafrigoribacterium mesophilum TaxID=433646 RepID=UPI003D155F35